MVRLFFCFIIDFRQTVLIHFGSYFRDFYVNPIVLGRIRLENKVALIKIVMHTKSGAPLEVMGLMQGKVTPERASSRSLVSL